MNKNSSTKAAIIAYTLLIPLGTILFNYYSDDATYTTYFIVTAISVFVGYLLNLVHKQYNFMQKELESLKSIDKNSNYIISQRLKQDNMKSFQRLFTTYGDIVDTENILMERLANDQISELEEFLSQFDKGLEFFPEHELISIDKHYTSFMKTIGKRGRYYACTFCDFWQKGEEILVDNFFNAHEEAANNGVKIKRVFLIRNTLKENHKELIKKHVEISRNNYENGGSIETKVLKVPSDKSMEGNDFGIYCLDQEPKAMAVGKFVDDNECILKGNTVNFERSKLESKLNTFKNRFNNPEAISIHRFVENEFEFND